MKRCSMKIENISNSFLIQNIAIENAYIVRILLLYAKNP